LRPPRIYHKDIPNGLLVIEDFGDDTYTRLFERGEDPKPLYEMAVDALVKLHKHPKRNEIDLPEHDIGTLVDGALLLLDWYYPALTGKKATEEMKNSFTTVLHTLFLKLPQDQRTLVLRDYHVDNLMRTPDGACGLLDFQDASIGQFSYDLMSLLEDARRDVPQELKQHLYERYTSAVRPDRKAFDYSFRVLAAQRHMRVMGVFLRLSKRDGKDRYLQWIPHVHKLFLASLEDPVLKPLRKWFEANDFNVRTPLKKQGEPS
jgi:aminoglycoside/choline kinase family phosphotransferase